MSFILLLHPSLTFLYGDFVHSRRFYSHLRLSSGNRHSGEILVAFIGSYSYFHIRTHIDYNIIFRGNRDILYYPDMHPQTHILIQIEGFSLSASSQVTLSFKPRLLRISTPGQVYCHSIPYWLVEFHDGITDFHLFALFEQLVQDYWVNFLPVHLYLASPRRGLFLMPWFPMRFGDKIVANRVTPYNRSASRQTGAGGP